MLAPQPQLLSFNFIIANIFTLFTHRNRLESNSEHWNALLLSLRELTEWVIRKDTELSTLGIGPLRGDAASLQKQVVRIKLLYIYKICGHTWSCILLLSRNAWMEN